MAESLREALGISPTLVPGRGGIFEVAVAGAVVAKKTPAGFPDEATVIRQVQQALQP